MFIIYVILLLLFIADTMKDTQEIFAGKKTIDMIKSSAESSIKLIKKSLFSQFGDEVSKKSKELLYLNSKLANVPC